MVKIKVEFQMTKVVVVIVNWNTCELTRDCLNSLLPEIKDIGYEVWIVDNASVDDSVTMLKKEFPMIRFIINDTNVGFARANNQIFRIAEGEYYLLLNTDTIIPPGSIQGLISFMDENPDAGAAGPRLKNAAGIAEVGLKPFPTLGGELRYCLVSHFFPFNALFSRLFGGKKAARLAADKPMPSEVLSAACLVIRREVIEKVGVLAEDYFLFSEENDYFYRMKQAGYKGYYLPNIEVIHLIGMSRKKRGSIDSEVNFFRSRLLFFRKFHQSKMFVLKVIYYFFFYWSYLVAGIIKTLKHGDDNYLGRYKALIKTLREGGKI